MGRNRTYGYTWGHKSHADDISALLGMNFLGVHSSNTKDETSPRENKPPDLNLETDISKRRPYKSLRL